MDGNSEVVSLYLDDIIPNRFQPREVFDDQALKELAVSIKEHGVIQPIIVRKVDNKYEIIAGERRYKASTMAGLTKIPAIVKNLDDKESSKVALIENLQRRDLTPIEEARTYQKILELEDNMTQEELAATMGKTQSSVSNKLRLLALPDEVQDALLKTRISERHARSLLNLQDKNDQIKMLNRIIEEKMTVRDLDKEIKLINDSKPGTGNVNPSGTAEGGATMNNQMGINNMLTANDIVGNVQNRANDNVSPLSSEQSTQAPTFNLANFGSLSSSTEPVTEPVKETSAPLVQNNPTTIDINKIRENSVDIGGVKPETVDVKELMKDTTEPQNEGFKFVPTFSFNQISGSDKTSSSTLAPQPTTNNFDQFFNSNIAKEPVNVASSIGSFGIAVPTKADLTPAITDIKNAITSLEGKGYKVSFEEADSDSSYKITINLQK